MKLREALKNHMGEKVKVGLASSFVFCGDVNEYIFDTMERLSEYEVKKRLRSYALETRKSHKTFMNKWADKMNRGLRRIKRTAAIEDWSLERYEKEIAVFMNECETEKERERENRVSNQAAEQFKKAWVSFLDRRVKEEYESIDEGTIIIIEGNESGEFWTCDEFERKWGT